MTKIAKGMKVRASVELTQVDGTPIESSTVEYVQGAGRMLRGIEAALEGMEEGQAKEGTLSAKDAFGTEADLPTMKIPVAQLPRNTTIAPGQMFEAKDLTGKAVTFRLLAFGTDQCEVRLLHPLAGKDIRYKVKVTSVVDPKAIPVPPAEAFLSPDDVVIEEK